jgi:hypothetical protein
MHSHKYGAHYDIVPIYVYNIKIVAHIYGPIFDAHLHAVVDPQLTTLSTLHSPTYSGWIPVCPAGSTGISGIQWTIFLYVLSLYGSNPAGLIYQIYTQNTRIPTGQIYSRINWNQLD